MSSPFTGKEIKAAFFTNEAHDTIEVVYNDAAPDEDPRFISVYIPGIDPNNYDVKNLFAEGYSYERIQKETVINNSQQHFAFRKLVKAEAAAEIEKVKKQFEEKYAEVSASGVSDFGAIPLLILDNNANEEYIFKAKIALFESPLIKGVKNTKGKAKVRGAKTLLDLFSAVNELITPKE
jgi:hypothetical protein